MKPGWHRRCRCRATSWITVKSRFDSRLVTRNILTACSSFRPLPNHISSLSGLSTTCGVVWMATKTKFQNSLSVPSSRLISLTTYLHLVPRLITSRRTHYNNFKYNLSKQILNGQQPSLEIKKKKLHQQKIFEAHRISKTPHCCTGNASSVLSTSLFHMEAILIL